MPDVKRELSIGERLDQWFDVAWNCWILGDHKEKMDSHGHCYRCGKRIR